MNKATMASILAVSAFTCAPGLLPNHHAAFAQLPGIAAAGQCQMEAQEGADYAAAMDKLEGKPADQAPALEGYLVKYPKSCVKDYVLLKIMIDYYTANDQAKTITAADNVLASNPSNLQAIALEVALRSAVSQAATAPADKQAALDAAADWAQKGLAITTPPAGTTPDQFKQMRAQLVPTFYTTIGSDKLAKGDFAGAISTYKTELSAVPLADTQKVGAPLQDTFFLGQAYYSSKPPDYLNCAFYTTRAAAYAPAPYNAQFQPLADYCYHRYHGAKDGYDKLVAMAKASLNPPADIATTITPAPTDADQANNLMKTTTDDQIPSLAVSDREYVLQYASDENKARLWNAFKGKEVAIPDGVVISSSTTVVTVAVDPGNVQSKTADFTFNMKPLTPPEEPKAKTPVALAAYKKAKAAYDKEVADYATATAVGKTVTLSGTWSSYTSSPIMITLDGGEVVPPKTAPKPAAKPAPAARKPHP